MKKPKEPRAGARHVPAPGKDASGDHPQEKKHLWSALFAAALCALFMQGVEYWGWSAGSEGRVLDLFLRWKPADTPSTATPPIILIKIDDAAYTACFDGTPPLNPKVLKQIVWSLVVGNDAPHASVLGVDVITDSQSREYVDTYREIRHELGELSKGKSLTAPIVWAAGADVSASRGSSFIEWMRGSEDAGVVQPTWVLGLKSEELQETPESDGWEWGLPVFPPDEDLRLRRFPRDVQVFFVKDGKSRTLEEASWARKVAERFGPPKIDKNVHEVVLSYSVPFADRVLGELYRCDKGDGETVLTPREPAFRDFKDQVSRNRAILLLGGTFGSGGDFHETSEGRKSGLEINARAIQAELAGNGIHEFPRILMLVLDVVIGFLIGLLFELKGWRIRALMWISVGVVLLVAGLSYVALWRGYVWLSCVGVALGANLHVLYEVYKMDLKTPKKH